MPIGVGAAILGAGALSAAGQWWANRKGGQNTRAQMRFQERMSNTAHQREMADLKKAGLNPILTGKYGGSSTPGGTAFQPENTLKDAPALASAYQLKQMQAAQIDQTRAQTELIKTQTANLGETHPKTLKTMDADIALKEATTALQQKQRSKVKSDIEKLDNEMHKIKFEGNVWKQINEEGPKETFLKRIKQQMIDDYNANYIVRGLKWGHNNTVEQMWQKFKKSKIYTKWLRDNGFGAFKKMQKGQKNINKNINKKLNRK